MLDAVRCPLAATLLSLLVACDPRPGPPLRPPAQAARPLQEADLGRITLTPEAERRLDLGAHLGTVARRPMHRTRTFGGDVLPRPGRALPLVAPLAGIIQPAGAGIPTVGARVTAGQALCRLAPFLSAVERLHVVAARAEAADQLARSQAQAEAAESALRRTEGLLAAESVGERLLEEARARRDTAQGALLAARIRRDGLAQGGPLLTAPFAGVLREVRVAPGQQVAAGALLFDLIDDDPVWVRVPVAAVEFEDIDAAQAAQVGGLRGGDAETRHALPVRPAPPIANPIAGTVELFYELANPQALLLPGQRVAVVLALRGAAEALTAPAAAILHDVHGATWVYESTGAQVYVRRRVQVEDIQDGVALLLTSAAAPGARVVTTGAIELFAVELGVGK